MNAAATIYDIRTAAPQTPAIVLLLGFAFLVVFLMGAFSARHPLEDRWIAAKLAIVFGVLFALWAMPHLEALWVTRHQTENRMQVVQGCVTNFERRPTPDPNSRFREIIDTDFVVAGRAFHFDTSHFHGGFRNEANSIHSGDRLRLVLTRNAIVRIERISEVCKPEA